MEDTTNDSQQEFDSLVREYNEWFESIKNEGDKRAKGFRRVLKSLTSVMGIFGDFQLKTSYETEFMFSRYGFLTSAQKGTVKLGSDFRRAINTLDKIISGETESEKYSIEDAQESRRTLERMYEIHRGIYAREKNTIEDVRSTIEELDELYESYRNTF